MVYTQSYNQKAINRLANMRIYIFRYSNWLTFIYFSIILVSGIPSYTQFFDQFILPKQLSVYFIAGISALSLSLFLFAYPSFNFSNHEKYLLLLILIWGLVFLLHRDFQSILNLFSFVTVYTLCKQIKNKKRTCNLFILGLTVSFCYSIIIVLYQYSKGGTSNGGYDTITGLSLTCTLLLIFLAYYLVNKGYKTYSIMLSSIALLLSILMAIRTAAIAICCISLFLLKGKVRLGIVILGVITIICLSIYKSDSTSGRFFIYRTSFTLFDSPRHLILGRGASGFRNSYMRAQAKELRKASVFEQNLADNVKHPLNEFLLFAINYGILPLIVGIILFILFILNGKSDLLSYSLLIAIFIFATFTYPFQYPITYITLAFALSRISFMKCTLRLQKNIVRFLSLLYMLISSILIMESIKLFDWNRDWKKAFTTGIYGMLENSLSEYDRLAESTLISDEFYYNWAYMLQKANKKEDARKAIMKCKIIDYDTQMLQGDLSALNGNYTDALQFYQEAFDMCPNRFMPLYAQFNLYNKLGIIKEKKEIGYLILTKKEKVPSSITQRIKENVYSLLYKTNY